MSAISPTNKYINFISFPWEYKGTTCEKIAGWAAFFFIGWIYHPIHAIQRCYKQLVNCGNVNSVKQKILFKDPISQGLAHFDNPHANGVVNGIYITTNETNLSDATRFLREHPRPSAEIQTIHIGCATWHNFDIMCERQSSYGLIVDFNPENAKFIEKTIEIINASESRDLFKQNMIAHLNSLKGKARDLFFHWDQQGLLTDRIEKELSREGSWLQTEESYLFIKRMVSRERVIAITEDITNFENFSSIRKFLDRSDIVIDTLYLSNVGNFMRTDQDKTSFESSVKSLLNNNTIFINCPKACFQQPILGKDFLQLSQSVVEKDKKQAATGSMNYESSKDFLGRDSIYILKRNSDKKGSGFGTASTQKIVEESFKLGFEGRIHNQAAWSSHIFHLYMGMIPQDREINFVTLKWGENALDPLSAITEKLRKKEPLSTEEQGDLKTLKRIVAHIKNVDKNEITDQDVIENEDKILALQDQKVSYLQCDFIPQLLKIFEQDPTKHHPETDRLGSVNMMMSDEGIARWKEAIDGQQPFKLFKKFEHLRPYMSSEQLSRFDRIMTIREKALQKTSST